MKQHKDIELDFEVDKLTNSIENAISGEVFDTTITLLKTTDTKQIKKTEWTFNWQTELKDKSRQVYKLTTLNNPTIIHGLINLTNKGDHVFMDLIESAKFNKGITGNLVAFACKLSFEKGYVGVVSFISKSQLIQHYEQTLGAKLFGGNRMFVDTREALILTTTYFKDFTL